LTIEDARKIENAVLTFYVEKGFEVFAHADRPTEPRFIVGKMSHQPLHDCDWQGFRGYSDKVEYFPLWIDGGMCLKKDLEDDGNEIFRLKKGKEMHEFSKGLVKYQPKKEEAKGL
jgi:hypothetical protein